MFGPNSVFLILSNAVHVCEKEGERERMGFNMYFLPRRLLAIQNLLSTQETAGPPLLWARPVQVPPEACRCPPLLFTFPAQPLLHLAPPPGLWLRSEVSASALSFLVLTFVVGRFQREGCHDLFTLSTPKLLVILVFLLQSNLEYLAFSLNNWASARTVKNTQVNRKLQNN